MGHKFSHLQKRDRYKIEALLNTGPKPQEIADEIEAVEQKFQGEGRVLIRPSGTEPLVRVMIEGKDQKVIDAEAKRLADLITKIMF